MVTVVVPWRPGCPDRERAWTLVRQQYRLRHPAWRVVEAVAADGPWCKATATAPAIEHAPEGVIVLADADVWCDRLELAVHAVESGLAPWAIPHFLVRRYGPDGEPCERPYRGAMGGGIVVSRRSTLIECPLDARFVGWGQEDLSLACALSTLHGQPWRGDADLTHYWHPPQSRMTRKHGSFEGRDLHRRYLKARDDPAAMRALIEEGRHVSRQPAQHAGHDHASSAGRDVRRVPQRDPERGDARDRLRAPADQSQ